MQPPHNGIDPQKIPVSKKRKGLYNACTAPFGAPAEIRTPDTLIKSQVLCLLSYRGITGVCPALDYNTI